MALGSSTTARLQILKQIKCGEWNWERRERDEKVWREKEKAKEREEKKTIGATMAMTVRYSSLSLSLPLSKNEKVEQYIKKKITNILS